MSLKDDILGASDLKTQSVPTPEWPSPSVTVGTFSAQERLELATKTKAKGDDANPQAGAWIVAYAVRDDAGQRVFSDDDVPALAKKNGVVIDRIVKAALDLNGMSAAYAADAAKNS